MALSTLIATLPFKCTIASNPSKPNLLFSSSRPKFNTSISDSDKGRNKVSFFQGFLTGGRDVQSLKVELYQTISPLDRGAEATREDQQLIASKIESLNSVKEPLKSDLLNGKWELLYTTSQSILQTQCNAPNYRDYEKTVDSARNVFQLMITNSKSQ
ncbi:probable plastid-lipid-associated protein 5, chloroplastic [Lotus japonicus]|uniref:probable plastid-lipid-associated protein 5, chloroplastic n=1 Tax=Lotus japonicus TaxID=34305 RepID=UPI002588CF03|nr:probable plastid-lipid-associated protein 5, chloroplastic [Lotus japonicus]